MIRDRYNSARDRVNELLLPYGLRVNRDDFDRVTVEPTDETASEQAQQTMRDPLGNRPKTEPKRPKRPTDAAPVELCQADGVRVFFTWTSTPWDLPGLDVLVIPVGPSGMSGEFARRYLAEMSEATRLELVAADHSLGRIHPAAPKLVRLSSPGVFPRCVILASAYTPRSDAATIEGAALAATAIFNLAVKEKFRRLAVPLIGTGGGGLGDRRVEVARLITTTAVKLARQRKIDVDIVDQIQFLDAELDEIRDDVLVGLQRASGSSSAEPEFELMSPDGQDVPPDSDTGFESLGTPEQEDTHDANLPIKVTFCVREKEGRGEGPDPGFSYPQVILDFDDSWNDYGFRTRYIARLFLHPDVEEDLGIVKIMRIGSEPVANELPPQFDRLDRAFCSLGSASWYEKLSEHPDIAPCIVESLSDRAASNPHEALDAQTDIVFRRSLMREGTHERTWNDVLMSAAPLRRLLGLPAGLDTSESSEPTVKPTHDGSGGPPGDELGQAASTRHAEREEAPYMGEVRLTAVPGAQGESDRPGGTEPTRDWDGKTVTLSIADGRVRLRHGFGENASTVVWDAPHVVDWTGLHFVDTASTAHSLAEALKLLPTRWNRAEVAGFGETLAKLLFGSGGPTQAVRALLVVPPGEQRRLVLDLDEVSYRVPWEYLRLDSYFLAEQRLSIIRHVAADTEHPRGLVIAPPKVVLFAYANPGTTGAPSFDGDGHRKRIFDVIRRFPGTVIDPAEQCTAADLEDLLCNRAGQVFHFLGHGEPGGKRSEASLIVHDTGGSAVGCKADDVARWMRDRQRDLAVLGACHGGASPEGGIMAGVGARIVAASGTPVVAMQMAVPQEFSTEFVARFYKELQAAKFDVEVAVYMARRAEHAGRHAFGIPVLLADVRALDSMPELNDPGAPGWAQFAVRIVLTASDARAAWGASTIVPREARAAVMRALANEVRPEAVFPAPPARSEELGAVIAELWQTLPGERAQEVSAVTASAAVSLLKPLIGEPTAIETLDDVALRDRVAPEHYRAAIRAVEGALSFPPGLVARMVGELMAGKHVLLTGPVGTGKTSMAEQVVKALGYAANLETASADWTRFEVQGGFCPTPAKDPTRLEFEFRPGVFVEAVLQNWREVPQDNGPRTWRRVARADGRTGTWLILDELNRADIDRALGGIFTALETRRLRLSVTGGTIEIPIPADFRVIATINGADRHFLFRLSDALKRRFAFVHVPVTTAWEDIEARYTRARVAKPHLSHLTLACRMVGDACRGLLVTPGPVGVVPPGLPVRWVEMGVASDLPGLVGPWVDLLTAMLGGEQTQKEHA